jgi:hypothetical protein
MFHFVNISHNIVRALVKNVTVVTCRHLIHLGTITIDGMLYTYDSYKNRNKNSRITMDNANMMDYDVDDIWWEKREQ